MLINITPSTPELQYLRELAKIDASSAERLQTPDPAEYSRHCPLWMVEILCGAKRVQAGFKVSRQSAVDLRPWGLVEARGEYLTAFGIGVRRALRKEDA